MSARKLNPAAVTAKLRAKQSAVSGQRQVTANPTTTAARTTATVPASNAAAIPQRTPVKQRVIQTTPVKPNGLNLTVSPTRQRLSSNVVESKLALNFHKARLATPKRTVTIANGDRPTAQLLQKSSL